MVKMENYPCKINKYCTKNCKGVFSDNQKIISLYGRSQKGKSTTLKLLMDKMLTNAFAAKSRNINTKAKDTLGVFEYVNAHNEKKLIGVTTRGDDCYALADDFSRLGLCDLYVCASRTKGCSLRWLEKRTKNGFLLRLSKATTFSRGVKPLPAFSEDIINDWQAEKLLEIVKSLL